MKKSLLLILVSIFVLSCNSDDDTTPETVVIESTLIAVDNLFGNGAEGIPEQNMVITNQDAWNNLIAQMDSVNNESDGFSEINIDFSEYTVIAAFDAIQGNGGHILDLTIMATPENILVSVTDLVPQGGATTVITQPYHIVKIPVTDLPIVFE
jgi:hypothetical protein